MGQLAKIWNVKLGGLHPVEIWQAREGGRKRGLAGEGGLNRRNLADKARIRCAPSNTKFPSTSDNISFQQRGVWQDGFRLVIVPASREGAARVATRGGPGLLQAMQFGAAAAFGRRQCWHCKAIPLCMKCYWSPRQKIFPPVRCRRSGSCTVAGTDENCGRHGDRRKEAPDALVGTTAESEASIET